MPRPPTTTHRKAHWADALARLAEKGLLRSPRTIESCDGRTVRIDGREVLLMCSNDYLGLANDPRIGEAAKRAIDDEGFGSGASRLISGTRPVHHELEESLAAFKGAEAALCFGSGYMANVGVIGALAGPGDAVFSDALNHASLIDGCRVSGADIHVYPHGSLGAASAQIRGASRAQRKLIVTDGVFSMDGDIAPLQGLCRLAEAYDAWLLVDDAHGTGVIGPNGQGTAAHMHVAKQVDVHIGTLSKAFGAYGAFVAGSRPLIDYILNTARSFIFSTAPPPAQAAAALEGLRIARAEPERRENVLKQAKRLRQGLMEMGLRVPAGETPIIPIMIGDVKRTMHLSQELFDQGLFIQGIRPPTVPAGTARLRVTVTAAHTDADIDRALEVFAHVMGVPARSE